MLMDKIASTIEHPWKVLGQQGSNVYLGGYLPDGQVYTIALKVVSPGVCTFASSHPRSKKQAMSMIRRDRPAIPAGLPSKVLRNSELPASEDAGEPAGHYSLRAEYSRQRDLSRPVASPLSDESLRVDAAEQMATFFTLCKALGPGERWITVHPHGPDEKGQPLLIKEQPDGSAKVVGGAGGSMNHFRLTGVKSEADYRTEAQSRDKAYRERKKDQAKQDKAAGLPDSEKAAKDALRSQLQEHQSAS